MRRLRVSSWFRPRYIAVASALIFSVAGFAHADVFGIGQAIQTGIANSIDTEIANIVGAWLNTAMWLLDWVVLVPTNLTDVIPSFTTIMISVRTLATLLALVSYSVEMFKTIHDPEGRSVSSIIVSFFKAAVLINAIPYILDFFLAINNGLVATIQSAPFGSMLSQNQTLKDIANSMINFSTGQSTTFNTAYLGPMAGVFGEYMVVSFVVVGLIAVALIAVAISNGVRYVELVFLLGIGPFLAATKTTGSDLYDVWGREMLAVVFSQAVQLFSIKIGLLFLFDPPSVPSLNGPSIISGMIIGFGGLIFAMRGPKTLRQLMYRGSSQGGGAMKNMVNMAGTAVSGMKGMGSGS